MKRIAFSAYSALFVLSVFALSPANAQVSCNGINALSECPQTGCGGGDGELNKMKNSTTVPSSGDVLRRTLAQLRAWQQPS